MLLLWCIMTCVCGVYNVDLCIYNFMCRNLQYFMGSKSWSRLNRQRKVSLVVDQCSTWSYFPIIFHQHHLSLLLSPPLNPGAVSPELLIRYAHRISQACATVSPVGWQPSKWQGGGILVLLYFWYPKHVTRIISNTYVTECALIDLHWEKSFHLPTPLMVMFMHQVGLFIRSLQVYHTRYQFCTSFSSSLHC